MLQIEFKLLSLSSIVTDGCKTNNNNNNYYYYLYPDVLYCIYTFM